MSQNSNSLTDPSLPLEDQSLLSLPPPLPSRQVRFLPDSHAPPNHSDYVGETNEAPDHLQQDSAGWQVDGSNHSLASDKTTSSFQAAYTMREYDDQLNTLKKENFNLKLRIYFMEERLGILQAPKDQENIYKVNIDLKVHSEELKKDLSEKGNLLSQAAQALESQEEKYKARIDNLTARLATEKERRVDAEKEIGEARMEIKELRDQKDSERRISDESKMLYTEAFGSICLGRSEDDQHQSEWEKQACELTDMLAEKNKIISDLEQKNSELLMKVREFGDIKDARYEVVEFKQKYEEVLRENQKLKMVAENNHGIISEYEKQIQDKEYIIKDCNIYIDSLTEQLNEKTEDLEKMHEKIQNSSSIQCRDEEIASLQADLVLHLDQQQKFEQMEKELKEHDKYEKNNSQKMSEIQASLADLQKENEEKNIKLKNLEEDLLIAKEQYKSAGENIVDCNSQITNLKLELEKRNNEIVGFINTLKRIKESLRTRGTSDYMINGDVFDIDTTDMSWDHGFDFVLEPTKDLIEKLVEGNLEKSKLLEDSGQDKDAHITYLNNRCSDLEAILAEKHHQLADLDHIQSNAEEMKKKLEECDKEQQEMQTYLNLKLDEMNQMRQEISVQKRAKSGNEEQLQKAISAIQGFITENQKLSDELTSVKAERDQLIDQKQSDVKSSDVLCLENERLRAEVEALSIQNMEAAAKTKFMQKGIDKATVNFESKLSEYREKFDCVVSWWRAGKEACELMRVRLEELADFLQQLLDMEENGADLNTSCISLDFRESLQKSIDESRLLSASILASQTSMIQEMSMVGLEVGDEDQIHDLDEEKWIVPEVEVSVFSGSEHVAQDEDTVPKTEYDTVLLELRDNLRKRRVAEEELEKMKERLSHMKGDQKSIVNQQSTTLEGKLQVGSKLPVASRSRSITSTGQSKVEARKAKSVEGRAKSASRSNPTAEVVDGHQRRRTLTKIPGPCFGEEEDCWSEPDKEESRRRIGLGSDSSSNIGHARDGGQSHRTTDDEIGGGELGTELRRERGRVERLRVELVNLEKREKNLQSELTTVKNELLVCTEDLQNLKIEEKMHRDGFEKYQIKIKEIEHESQQLREQLKKVSEVANERNKLEHRLKERDIVIESLNNGIKSLEEENKKMKGELQGGNVEKAIENSIKAKNQEIEKLTQGLNRYEAKCKQMIDQYNGLTEEVEKWKAEALTKSNECSHANEEIKTLNEDVGRYESYCDKMKEEYELLQVEVSKWKGIAIEREKAEDLAILVAKYEEELKKTKKHTEKGKAETEKLKSINSKLDEKCRSLDELLKQSNSKTLDLEEKVRFLSQDTERRDKILLKKSENLDEAEGLLKELNERKRELKTRLEEVLQELSVKKLEAQTMKDLHENYKREHNDEITQNKVNEIETKMQSQVDAMKKFAEEMVRIESEKKELEVELREYQSLMITTEKKMKNMTECLEKEKYNGNELGKTIEHLRKSVHKLETEKMLKESLEIEFKNLQEALKSEKELTKNLNEKIEKLKISTKLTEDRCNSAEKVLKTLSAESFSAEKENQKSNLSKLEMEAVLQHSRPASRRQGLSSVDQNSSALCLSNSLCCSHLADLKQVKLERDAALAKLNSTRSSLATTAEKLSASNKRKKQVEKAICKELTKTHEVLRKTKTNLENVSGGKS